MALLPVLLGLHYLGLEEFHWPSKEVWVLLTLSSFMANFLFDYCFMRSIILMGPLLANTGLCLSFPISLYVDVYVFEKKFTWFYFLGSACVFTAFAVIMFSSTKTKSGEKPLEISEKSNSNQSGKQKKNTNRKDDDEIPE